MLYRVSNPFFQHWARYRDFQSRKTDKRQKYPILFRTTIHMRCMRQVSPTQHTMRRATHWMCAVAAKHGAQFFLTTIRCMVSTQRCLLPLHVIFSTTVERAGSLFRKMRFLEWKLWQRMDLDEASSGVNNLFSEWSPPKKWTTTWWRLLLLVRSRWFVIIEITLPISQKAGHNRVHLLSFTRSSTRVWGQFSGHKFRLEPVIPRTRPMRETSIIWSNREWRRTNWRMTPSLFAVSCSC